MPCRGTRARRLFAVVFRRGLSASRRDVIGGGGFGSGLLAGAVVLEVAEGALVGSAEAAFVAGDKVDAPFGAKGVGFARGLRGDAVFGFEFGAWSSMVMSQRGGFDTSDATEAPEAEAMSSTSRFRCRRRACTRRDAWLGRVARHRVLVLEDGDVFGAEAFADAIRGACGFAFNGLRAFGWLRCSARFGSDAWVDHGVDCFFGLLIVGVLLRVDARVRGISAGAWSSTRSRSTWVLARSGGGTLVLVFTVAKSKVVVVPVRVQS